MANRKLISDTIEKALNNQIEMEAAASFNYLAIVSWCEERGLKGCAGFFMAHSEEERQHMMKFFNYVNAVGGFAVAPNIKKPSATFSDIKKVFEKALSDEQKVTKSIHELTELATKERDHATYSFLQFFIQEQLEEEQLFTNAIERIELIGLDGKGLYYIDKEIELLRNENG
jgi:ferritin